MAIQLDNKRLVTIYGGSGFLGGHVVRALARTGVRMRIAVRRPDLAGHLQPLGSLGQIHAVQGNVRYPESVAAAARGADALINMVGILYETGGQKFASVQKDGARAVAEAAKAHGIKTIVHVSAIGAASESPSLYAQSKSQGEQAVLKAVPEAIVLRPSIMFGPEDSFFNRFAALARMLPALPLLGGGHTRLQPVYAGDVAEVVLRALKGETRPGAIYELGGPEILTMKEIMQRVLRYTQRRRLLLPLPFPLAKLQAFFLQLLPNPPLTVDQVKLLESDNVVSDEAKRKRLTLEGLGIDPMAIELIVPSYMGRFRPKGQFADYKL